MSLRKGLIMYLKQIEDACLCNRLSFLSLVANLSQLLLSFLLVNNIVAKKSRAGGRFINFPFGEDFEMGSAYM